MRASTKSITQPLSPVQPIPRQKSPRSLLKNTDNAGYVPSLQSSQQKSTRRCEGWTTLEERPIDSTTIPGLYGPNGVSGSLDRSTASSWQADYALLDISCNDTVLTGCKTNCRLNRRSGSWTSYPKGVSSATLFVVEWHPLHELPRRPWKVEDKAKAMRRPDGSARNCLTS